MTALALSHDANALERLQHTMAQLRADTPLVRIGGVTSEITPAYCRVQGLSALARIGDMVTFDVKPTPAMGAIVALDGGGARVKLFETNVAIGVGDRAYLAGALTIAPHESWKGRVIDARGAPIDGAGPLQDGDTPRHADRQPPGAMQRARLGQGFRTGVRAIDAFCPIVRGQRIGIFAGSGVGKSTTLGMFARSPDFDIVVVALVGERGREVREFLDDILGAARERTITVVATADESPMMRRLAAATATTVAEHFRDRGRSVLLIVDSITRYAHAAREVALAAGEPPVARGYAPSVFSDLPRLLERAGAGRDGGGSITGVYAVLVDGDDHNEPVADCVRGALDGHIVLDRAIAEQGRFPAIDVLRSLSRLATSVWTAEQRTLITRLRRLIARYEDSRDMRMLGGYRAGADAELDQAVALTPKLYEALQQSPDSPASIDAFREIAEKLAR